MSGLALVFLIRICTRMVERSRKPLPLSLNITFTVRWELGEYTPLVVG